MLEILAITTPIFLIIGIGFVSVRGGLFARGDMRVLSGYVINFALPAIIFSALAQRSFDEIFDTGYLLAYGVGSFSAFVGGALLFRLLRRRPAQASVIAGMGTSMSNSAFIGLPVISQVIGPVASIGLALNMLIENLIMLPLVLALADSLGQRRTSMANLVRDTGLRLIKNPMILGMFFGLAFSLSGLRAPTPFMKAVDMLAVSASPVALFVIGGNLAGSRVGGLLKDVAVIVVGKLLLHPLLVLAMLLWLPGMPPMRPEIMAAAILFASMPMLSVYPIFGMRYGLETACSAVVVGATVMSFFTISGWIWGVRVWVLG